MRDNMRLAFVGFVVLMTIACGAPQQESAQQPASTPAGQAAMETPAAGGAGPAGSATSTPSGDTRTNAAPQAQKPAEPVMMLMDVPSGTDLVLTLETPVSSETAKAEQVVRATVAKPVVISGMTVIAEGAPVTGTVVAVERSGRVKGRASIALRFNEVTVAKTDYKISTARITRVAEATKGEDAKKIGIGAGVGTAIGAIAGGKKGAAIGAGIGGGAGTGAVLATRGKEVEIPAGATLRTTIQETVRINAPM